MQVFISYTQNDSKVAQRFSEVLKESGVNVWFDKEKIFPGDNWAAKVSEGLEDSQAMIVLLSPESVNSSSLLKEIEYALSQKRYKWRLFPVILGDPDKISDKDIPWVLKRLNMIYLDERNERETMEKITNALVEGISLNNDSKNLSNDLMHDS